MRHLPYFIRRRVKVAVVWLGMKGLIPLWLGDWLIQRGGLSDA
ncbi:hypothetical protein ACJ41P_05135 [Azospirillum argentinense]|uniref:Uncharacterized protein n=1 Tax=Azospirillum argentinense TaxID=2970906 RepID=A0ABW8V550_9PROT